MISQGCASITRNTPAGAAARRVPARRNVAADRLTLQLFLEDVIDEAGIGLAARRLHHLADEPAEGRGLSFAIHVDLPRVAGDHLFDRGLDTGAVRDLDESLFSDDVGRLATAREHL